MLAKPMEKKAWRLLHKNDARYIEQVLEVAPYKAAVVRPTTTYLKNYPSQSNQIWGTLLEK